MSSVGYKSTKTIIYGFIQFELIRHLLNGDTIGYNMNARMVYEEGTNGMIPKPDANRRILYAKIIQRIENDLKCLSVNRGMFSTIFELPNQATFRRALKVAKNAVLLEKLAI